MQNKEYQQKLQLVPTADGSMSIFHSEIGEHYHSKHGAYQESIHVFVNSGLLHHQHKQNTNELSILEIGFGTGFNFLLSADAANEHFLSLKYRGIEAFPLQFETIDALNYHQYIKNKEVYLAFKNKYQQAFENEIEINSNVHLKIDQCALLNFQTDERYDIIYFDAFAKVHQADMWTYEAIAHACKFLKDKGIFVTYSVTGELKRQLKSLGFEIERPQGAPGKREMMRATLHHDL